TSFYKIWVSSIVLDSADSSTIQTTSRLEEHGGVVHAVQFSEDGMTLASTSDDRSVRKWTWDATLQMYQQQWVGWGHSARVWAVSFASENLVTVSEDGTARVWAGESGEELACIHHGAPSGSLWTVDSMGEFMVMGATDGIVSGHDLGNRIRDKNLSIIDSVSIPDDRPKEPQDSLSVDSEAIQLSAENGEKKKTKKKRKKVRAQGVPMSCAYNEETNQIVIGDSRGSISLFSLTEGSNEIVASLSVIHRAHQKEHVCSLKWVNCRTIVSAGNDGSLNTSYVIEDALHKGWSFPASLMSGISRLFDSQNAAFLEITQSPVLVGGYYGNTFRTIDAMSGFENVQVKTGGRQRILDFNVEPDHDKESGLSAEYALAVCMGEQNGSNSVYIQQMKSTTRNDEARVYPSIARGVKLHGETVFESAMFTLIDSEFQFLVTSSEDCTTRVSAWHEGAIVDSLMLDPQVSCVRCVSSSQIDEKSVLLAIGGGKLMIQFFVIQVWPDKTIRSVHDLRITYLGKGTNGKKKEAHIDQRFNAVKVVPVDKGKRVHLVIAGDSNGFAHIFLIPEDIQRVQDHRSTLGMKFQISARPILCIETVTVWNRVLLLIGTTKGDILFYDLPTSYSELEAKMKAQNKAWDLLGACEAHQMGTNTLSAFISSIENEQCVGVTIVSGGDDHSLCFTHIKIQQNKHSDTLSVSDDRLVRSVREASCSAIKSVNHVTLNGKKFILAAGYSQILSLWNIPDDITIKPHAVSTARIDLGDVNCMTFSNPSNGASEAWVAACGMGVEMFKLCQA
ncbi:MAG: hypothetical protein SGILL_002349, partial [Bacillariaceae sp.]